MNGNKWRLFYLDFSFIGWELLCSVPLYAEGFLVLKYFTGSEAVSYTHLRSSSDKLSRAASNRSFSISPIHPKRLLVSW